MAEGVNLRGNQFLNILTATTTVVCPKGGVLASITCNKAVASGVITIYDNASAASGTIVGTITHPGVLLQSQYCLPFNANFSNGLTIVTSSTDDITVSFRQT